MHVEGGESMVRSARAIVGEDADGWPRLTVDTSLHPSDSVDFGRSHVWRVALAHADASTIEYKGDESAGGFDVCCDFVKGSRCVLRRARRASGRRRRATRAATRARARRAPAARRCGGGRPRVARRRRLRAAARSPAAAATRRQGTCWLKMGGAQFESASRPPSTRLLGRVSCRGAA